MNSRAVTGLLMMAVGMVLIPIGDAIAKHLSEITPYSAGFIAWSRFATGVVLVGPFGWRAWCRRPESGVSTRRFVLQQSLRGFLIAATITLIITAVGKSPIADVFGAFFVGPALAVVLSVVLLRETVGWMEWASVGLGFIGVLFVVQPTGEVSSGMLWALAAGVFYGGFLVATRWAARSGPPMSQLAMQLLVGFVLLLPLAWTDVRDTGLLAPAWLLTMGITSAAANYLSIQAMARAGAAWLAPVVYLQIVAASCIGVWVFGDRIGAVAAVGLVLILSAGLFRIPAPGKRQAQ